jgi:phosphatidylglycerol---prolipoprotein diacylglyceryl transferase
MYPDLSYLFHDVFGTQMDNWTSIFKSFGLMLGMAFLACAWLLKSEFTRLEAEGKIKAMIIANPTKAKAKLSEMLFNSLFAAVIVAKIPYVYNNFDAFKGDPASVIFSTHGNWMIGIIVGLSYCAYLYFVEQKRDITVLPDNITVRPYERTMDIILLAAVSGVVGSKLFSILENLEDFFRDPIGQIFSGSGLTVYGGLIMAFIVVYYYVRKNGIKPIYMMDIAGMGILLGYGIGRIGCQVAGDSDWGIVAGPQPTWWFLPDWLWSYHYPHNVSNDGVTIAGCNADAITSAKGAIEERCKAICGIRYCHYLDPMVFPTPVYETIISLLGFLLLFIMRKRIKIPGFIFFLYMIYNGIERFFIEKIRINEKYKMFGLNLSQAQYISIGFVIIGIAGCLYLWKSKDAKPPSLA